MVVGVPPVPAFDAFRIVELLREAFYNSAGGNPSLQMIGSTIIQAHHCSAGI